MKKTIKLLAAIVVLMATLSSCHDDDVDHNSMDKGLKVTGVAEKGPFATGSKVTLHELNEKLEETGRTFEGVTDAEGRYEIDAKRGLRSRFARISVEGKFFNEIKGADSDEPMMLDAMVTVENGAENVVNINLLTYLEADRIIELIKTGKNFDEAKKAAGNEVLAAFLIKDKQLDATKVSITSNGDNADILIAISSILLNGGNDVEVTQVAKIIKEEIKKNGVVSEATALMIKSLSYDLVYPAVIDNLKEKYSEFEKNIKIGKIQYYIDGEGRGEIGYDWSPKISTIDPEWGTELDFIKAYKATIDDLSSFVEYYRSTEYAYAGPISNEEKVQYAMLKPFHEHSLVATDNIIQTLYFKNYKSIARYNSLIEVSIGRDYAAKYAASARVLRAYQYLLATDAWGDAILSIENLSIAQREETGSVVPPPPSKTSKEDIINFLIQDIETAYPLLETGSNANHLATKGFADALLAKLYLAKGEYSKALESVAKLNDTYKLEVEREKVFNNASSNESLFSLPHTKGTYPANIVKQGSHQSLIRYAEVLLIAAEANMEQGNATVDQINKLRARNGKEGIAIASSKEEIRDAILEEYSTDLAKEGSTFATMKRMNVATSLLGIEEETFRLLFPFPINEIDLNKNLKQNPGYTIKNQIIL